MSVDENRGAVSSLRSGNGKQVIGEFPSSLVHTQLLSPVCPGISAGNQRLIRTTRGSSSGQREAEINHLSQGGKTVWSSGPSVWPYGTKTQGKIGSNGKQPDSISK